MRWGCYLSAYQLICAWALMLNISLSPFVRMWGAASEYQLIRLCAHGRGLVNISLSAYVRLGRGCWISAYRLICAWPCHSSTLGWLRGANFQGSISFAANQSAAPLVKRLEFQALPSVSTHMLILVRRSLYRCIYRYLRGGLPWIGLPIWLTCLQIDFETHALQFHIMFSRFLMQFLPNIFVG